jgi:hypothetical protein
MAVIGPSLRYFEARFPTAGSRIELGFHGDVVGTVVVFRLVYSVEMLMAKGIMTAEKPRLSGLATGGPLTD